MGSMQVLQETYHKARDYVGKADEKGYVLLPIAHSTQNAQIEIVIGLDGTFKSARKVEKVNAVTIIPVTEDSGSRASGIAPHPLHDKLCYIAGDYKKYYDKKKSTEFYQAYIGQLKEWVDFGCHKYVEGVYTYINKKTVVEDLIREGILCLTESGRLDDTIKIEGISQPEAFVRFRIQDETVMGMGEMWKDRDVYENYKQYYLGKLDKVDLDYITGEYMACSDKHPSKIRNSADKSKIISANDSRGFTYRGRFKTKEEVVSVGYTSSQEAHNALKWLIERQGYRRYDMCIVTWNPEQEEVPDWIRGDSLDVAYDGQDDFVIDLSDNYSEQLNKAMKGRYSSFENPSKQIVVMSLDAATTGRLSITFYQQMKGAVLLKNLVYWYSSCCWNMSYITKKKHQNLPLTPTLEDIARAAYGVERNGFLDVFDAKLMKDTLKRLIPCVIGGRKIPKDIVKAAFERACRPQAYENYNRRKILDIACALIRKENLDRKTDKKGDYESMSLNYENHNRDYLYGRLLAVAHKLEYDTYSDEEKGKRLTNAERYRTMLVKNPKRTWMDITKKIQPYEKKLSQGASINYQKKFQEIYDAFNDCDFSADGKLGEQVLLGYHCQLSELWNHKVNAADENV